MTIKIFRFIKLFRFILIIPCNKLDFICVPHPRGCQFPSVLQKLPHWIWPPAQGWSDSSNHQQFLQKSIKQNWGPSKTSRIFHFGCHIKRSQRKTVIEMSAFAYLFEGKMTSCGWIFPVTPASNWTFCFASWFWTDTVQSHVSEHLHSAADSESIKYVRWHSEDPAR